MSALQYSLYTFKQNLKTFLWCFVTVNDSSLYTRNERTVKTVDWEGKMCSKEGKRSISRKNYGHQFLRCTTYHPHRLFGKGSGNIRLIYWANLMVNGHFQKKVLFHHDNVPVYLSITAWLNYVTNFYLIHFICQIEQFTSKRKSSQKQRSIL